MRPKSLRNRAHLPLWAGVYLYRASEPGRRLSRGARHASEQNVEPTSGGMSSGQPSVNSRPFAPITPGAQGQGLCLLSQKQQKNKGARVNFRKAPHTFHNREHNCIRGHHEIAACASQREHARAQATHAATPNTPPPSFSLRNPTKKQHKI